MNKVKKGSAYPYRIQVRLSGAARASLDAYCGRHGLCLSAGVRALCRGAQVRVGGFGRGGAGEAVVHQNRFCLRRGKHKGDGFVRFFMNPSDIGVRLDQACWDRLAGFSLARGLSVSEGVRLLCLEATPRFTGKAAGVRVGGARSRWEQADWVD